MTAEALSALLTLAEFKGLAKGRGCPDAGGMHPDLMVLGGYVTMEEAAGVQRIYAKYAEQCRKAGESRRPKSPPTDRWSRLHQVGLSLPALDPRVILQ